VLGDRGAGTPNHFGMTGKDVDIYIGSMAYSLCASGGFCAGSVEIVDHQRLGSSAYVFSASLPAMLAVSAIVGIEHLQQNADKVLLKLRQITAAFRRGFEEAKCTKAVLVADTSSPLVHLRALNRENSRQMQECKMQRIVDRLNSEYNVIIPRVQYVAEM